MGGWLEEKKTTYNNVVCLYGLELTGSDQLEYIITLDGQSLIYFGLFETGNLYGFIFENGSSISDYYNLCINGYKINITIKNISYYD